MDDEIVWVTCDECGHEQPDMGRNVTCEECGYGPMPYEPPEKESE
jgi:ribosomal protein L37E